MTRQPARLGPMVFIYSDPAVDVTSEQRTIEHETIDKDVVVQTIGRKPDQIEITGVVPDYDLDVADTFTQLGVIELRSERWNGDVIVKSVNTTFKRAKAHVENEDGPNDSAWLYDITITCIEVSEETSSVEELLIQDYGP